MTRLMSTVLTAVLATVVGAPTRAQDDPFGRQPTLRSPPVESVKSEAFRWLASVGADRTTRDKAARLWAVESADLPAIELLGRLVATFALADARVRELVDLCSKPRQAVTPPAPDWLADESTPPLVRNNVRLYFGRWLAREGLHDESLEQLAGIRPEAVVDPASLLFYQAVGHHRLLQKEQAAKAIDRLLGDVVDCPARYAALATMMQHDLKGLQDDSLDHVARRMSDIERRLALGRAGPKVRKVEDSVIDSLDKMIEELEKQQQQQQGGGGGGSNQGPGGPQSSSPAGDSRIMGGQGPGGVAPKNIGAKSGWGNLPPKERERVLQEIGKDFPAHYRDVIEQYFRRLAREASDKPK